MGLILLPRRFNQQPQQMPIVDWGCPITTSLVFAAIPQGNLFADVVTGALGIPSGAGIPTLANSATGRNMLFNGGAATNSYATFGATDKTAADIALGPCTWFFWAAPTGQGGLAERDNVKFDNIGWAVGIDSASKVKLVIENSSNNAIVNSNTAVTLGAYTSIAVTWDAASRSSVGFKFYIGGVDAGFTNTGTGSGTASSDSGDTLYLGRNTQTYNGNSSVGSFAGNMELAAFFKRALSPAEIFSLHQNRFQLFKSTKRRIWVSAGSVAYTKSLTATASVSSAKEVKKIGAIRKATASVGVSSIAKALIHPKSLAATTSVSAAKIIKTVGAIRKATASVSVAKIIKALSIKKATTASVSVAKAIKKVITTKKASASVSIATLIINHKYLKAITASASVSSAKMAKQIGAIRKATASISVATISKIKILRKTITTTASASVAKIVKQVGAIRKATSISLLKDIRAIRKALSAASTSVANASKGLRSKLVAIQGEAAKLVRQARIIRLATSTHTQSLSSRKIAVKILAASSISVMRISKFIRLTKASVSASASGFKRKISKAIKASSGSLSKIGRGFMRIIKATSLAQRFLNFIHQNPGRPNPERTITAIHRIRIITAVRVITIVAKSRIRWFKFKR